MELNNNAEGGTDTSTVTAGNSGGVSGNAFDSVVGTPTITFDSTHALGTLAYKVVGAGTAQQLVWAASLGTHAQLYGRFYIWSNGNPSVATGLLRFTVGGVQSARLRINADGTLTISDNGNSPEITTAAAIPTGQWVRVEFQVTFAPTTGTCNLNTYNTPDSLTPTESLSSTSLNALTNCDTVQIGSFNGVTWTGWLDSIQINDTGYPGPVKAKAPAMLTTPTAVHRAASW